MNPSVMQSLTCQIRYAVPYTSQLFTKARSLLWPSPLLRPSLLCLHTCSNCRDQLGFRIATIIRDGLLGLIDVGTRNNIDGSLMCAASRIPVIVSLGFCEGRGFGDLGGVEIKAV